MRSLLTLSVGAALLAGTVCHSASAGPPDDKQPCEPVVNCHSQRICIDAPPPEVVVRSAYAAPICQHPLLHRCGHFFHRHHTPMAMYAAAPTYAMAPVAATFAPTYAYAPAAPTFAFAPAAPSFAFAPAAPAFAFAPAAPTFAAPAAANFAFAPSMANFSMPTAPVFLNMTPMAPTAPAAPVQPTAPANDINDVLKKLTNSVELLTKMVRQQTKILEYHENWLNDLEKRVGPGKNMQPTPPGAGMSRGFVPEAGNAGFVVEPAAPEPLAAPKRLDR